jgi:hypothetical protein
MMSTVTCWLAGRQGLTLERIGCDGPGDGHGCMPAGRTDRDHADDLAGQVGLMMLAGLLRAARLLPRMRPGREGSRPRTRR